jgi:hypothetical protein
VAVGLLGLVLGGGAVALFDHDGYGPGHGRGGYHSQFDGRGDHGPRMDRAPRPGWDNHGRFDR